MSKPFVVMISANAEWNALAAYYGVSAWKRGPFGGVIELEIDGKAVIFAQGGWGKVAAAASAQYALCAWQPRVLLNLGTCGGFAGAARAGEVLLVERTLIYDIVEQMGDPEEAIRHYAVDLDLSWLAEPYPQAVRRGLLISADRDIVPADVSALRERFGATAADWESGAIAWTAQRNGARCLILRAVTDLVGATGGEAYGADGVNVFQERTRQVMGAMLAHLPGWLNACGLGEES